MGNVDVWVGTDYTVCTKSQRTDETRLSTYLLLTNNTGFFLSGKSSCVSFETFFWREILCNYFSEQSQIQEPLLFCKNNENPAHHSLGSSSVGAQTLFSSQT